MSGVVFSVEPTPLAAASVSTGADLVVTLPPDESLVFADGGQMTETTFDRWLLLLLLMLMLLLMLLLMLMLLLLLFALLAPLKLLVGSSREDVFCRSGGSGSTSIALVPTIGVVSGNGNHGAAPSLSDIEGVFSGEV